MPSWARYYRHSNKNLNALEITNSVQKKTPINNSNSHVKMEPQKCQLLDENTTCFVKSRDKINNYQKISTMMNTDNWVPLKDHLKDIHETYMKCKKISKVKHWLNEFRMLYNACQMFSTNPSEYDNVFILLYFKTYPVGYTEMIILYVWYCDVLQLLYGKQKNNSGFDATVFFKEMFRENVDNCSKHVYLNNEKDFVSINLIKGKEMPMDSFVKLFETLVINNNSYCFLTLIQLYSCFYEYFLLNSVTYHGNIKPKPGYEFNKCASKWLRKMLILLKSQFKHDFLSVYRIFQPHLNDYLVCIPDAKNLKQFHVKHDSLEKLISYEALLDQEKLSVIDLLVNSNFIQIHTEYLETLNMYLYISKNQTSINLLGEMKCLYYKFNDKLKVPSSSDAMIQRSLENYHVDNCRKFHITVFQQWLVQKIKFIVTENLNLFHMFSSTLYGNHRKLILEKFSPNYLPSPELKEFFMNFVKSQPDHHDCFTVLLNFFVCHVEFMNIDVEFVIGNPSVTEISLEYIGKTIEKLEYKDKAIKLNQDDFHLWNLLFNQNDLHLYNQLQPWLYKAVRNWCEKGKIKIDYRKFQIPSYISNHYMEHLRINKHRLSNYISSQLTEKLPNTANHKSSFILLQENLNNLHDISQEFISNIKKLNGNIITDKNVQLIVNTINYVHCFLGIQKFCIDQNVNEYILHQNKTFDFNHSYDIVSCSKHWSESLESQTPEHSEMNHSNINQISEVNKIKTKAIIEHCEPNSRKRPLENGSHKPESPIEKKSRQAINEREESIVTEPDPTNLDTVIIIESDLPAINPKVTVFEDQFKKKLDNLTQEYSDLIDTTSVKIKQENETSSKTKLQSDNCIATDSGNVSNDSSDESDVIVLGPGPPKQFDVITLNENGEEVNDKEKKDDVEEGKGEIVESDKDEIQKEAPQGKQVDKSLSIEKEIEDVEDGVKICTFPKKWTQEMVDFYTLDVNPDQFKQKIQSKITITRPNLWWFDYQNSYRYHDSQFGYNKICDNCGSRLHDPKNCPKPCFSVCPMCGGRGHAPDRCPESQCLNCGKKTDEYLFNCEECDQKVVLKIKCDICHRLYHSNDHCPFLWRSMEFTTRKGKLKVIPAATSCNNTKYCSNCAGRGHLIEECSHLSSEHPLRQDSTWKVLHHAYTTHLVHYKLRANEKVSRVLLSKSGMELLQNLSNQSGVNIEYLVDEGVNVLMYKANPAQSHFIRSQLKKHLFAS